MPMTVTVLEVLDDHRSILSCALCQGSGRKPGYKPHVPCDVCGGKGVVLVEAEPPFVTCRLCEGTGNKPGYKPWVACDACRGVGAQPIVGSYEIIR